MRQLLQYPLIYFIFIITITIVSCNSRSSAPSTEAISSINLKRGALVLCGPPDHQLGTVEFVSACSEKVRADFNIATALLHSFEYDEAEKAFAKVIDQEPGCAMAYWGVAMSNYHQLWPSPPSTMELEKGAKAIAVARTLTKGSSREAGYIEAIGTFYKDWNKVDHPTRSLNFTRAMEKLHQANPDDKEAAIFYALALDATAPPTDKTFSNQKKAWAILTALYPGEPDHPGIVHYLIHTYDNPEMASLALPAAKKYASIAPSSAHAQHMPSHIFTRLGLWNECIQSNLASSESAKCYASTAGIKGHWDEELHAMDYLMYAYLQKGANKAAREQWNYLNTIHNVEPANFKVAYAFAAIPSRYVLENKLWKDAAALEVHTANFQWKKYPWQKALIHFTRLLGAANLGRLDSARSELKQLYTIYDTLVGQKEMYKASQVNIQIKSSEAWLKFKEGQHSEALKLMQTAASMEDSTEKSPVTPGEIIPARELLADMLIQMNDPASALEAYEADLKRHPNRFNALYGAAFAAEKKQDREKATRYYQQLLHITDSTGGRPELETAKHFLRKAGR